MNTKVLDRLLVEAKGFIADALHEARQGYTTQALVDAEAAWHRLRSVMDLYRNVIPELQDLPNRQEE